MITSSLLPSLRRRTTATLSIVGRQTTYPHYHHQYTHFNYNRFYVFVPDANKDNETSMEDEEKKSNSLHTTSTTDNDHDDQNYYTPKKVCRKWDNFRRYIFAIQYNGNHTLGFSRNPYELYYSTSKKEEEEKEKKKNIIINSSSKSYLSLPPSVESRLEDALEKLVGRDNFENIQVSSRTDRGVHALMNTIHVDIRKGKRKRKKKKDCFKERSDDDNNEKNNQYWDTLRLQLGMNHHLRHQGRTAGCVWNQYKNFCADSVCVTQVIPAPILDHNITPKTSPITVLDFHARHNTIQRTYMYRIMVVTRDFKDWGTPFSECNDNKFSWRLKVSPSSTTTCSASSPSHNLFNIKEMKNAAKVLEGIHDFTSFRGNSCQRKSPFVHIKNISISSSSCAENNKDTEFLFTPSGNITTSSKNNNNNNNIQTIQIHVTANAFLYRQVRNIVGCLVDVGRGKLDATAVSNILKQKNRKTAPYAMAPSHGLFLVHVKHEFVEDINFGLI